MEKSYQDLLTTLCSQAEEVVGIKCKISVEPFNGIDKMVLRIIRKNEIRIYPEQIFEENFTSYRDALEDAAKRILLDVFIEGCFSKETKPIPKLKVKVN